MTAMRVFLDANILFSAAKSDGAIRKLLTLSERAGHTLVADDYVIAEARRNLELKFHSAMPALDALTKRIEVRTQRAADQGLAGNLPLPDKDKPVLLAAIAARCQVLVTGDKTHFGPLYGRTIGGVTVHSPRSLADEIL